MKRSFAWSIAGALVFFGLLWLLDFPKPMIDDLFYTGAGLNLASGGDFSNPLLVRQQFPSHYFLMYPPVHPHLLAGWLKVFGINAASMTGFQSLMYFIAAAATITVLRKQGAPVWLQWLVPLGVTGAFLNIGLRPEPVAVALIMAGFALVEICGTQALGRFAGFFLLSLGIATAPRTALFGIVLSFANLGLWYIPGASEQRRRVLGLYALAGLVLAVLVFLWMIDFRLLEFISVFRYNTQNRIGGKIALLVRYLKVNLAVTQMPFLALLVALAAASFRHPLGRPARIGLCLTAMFPCVALIGGLGHGAIWFAVLGVLLLTGSLWEWTGSRSQQLGLSLVVCAVFFAASSKPLVGAAGWLRGRIKPDLGPQFLEAVKSGPSPEHPVLLDSWVARYTFNYRLPIGALDWSFAAPFPADGVTDAPLRPGDVFFIGPPSVDMLTAKGYLNLPTPKWYPPGLKRWAFDEFPRRVYVIRAEDCKETGR